MPHGELLIKTHKAVTGRDANGYVDAFDRYGLSLEKMSPLLMEPGNKEPVGNSNALTNGVSYLGSTIGVKDENHISLEVHLYAANESQFLTRYELFCDEVLRLDRGEFIRLKTNRHPNRVYRVFHQNFQQFSTFNMEMAKFVWVMKEPHPELRDAAAPTFRYAVVAVADTDYELEQLIQISGFLQDGDYAVVQPSTVGEENSYVRIFYEDDAPQGGPIWETDNSIVVDNGNFVKNITDGNYWQFAGQAGGRGVWKKHWY